MIQAFGDYFKIDIGHGKMASKDENNIFEKFKKN